MTALPTARVDQLHAGERLVVIGHLVVVVDEPAPPAGFDTDVLLVLIRRVDRPGADPAPLLLPRDFRVHRAA